MNGHALDAGGPRFAIVGIGCRLPGGAGDHRAFWRNLAAGKCCVVDAPASRFDAATLVSRDPARPGRRASGRGGYIDGFDEFDPAFFGIGAREAEAMDPQQRKLLEVAWEALEDAGQRPAELAGQRVGVFIGASAVDYQILQFADLGFAQITEHTATGTALAMVAGRIAAWFDFRGPALAIDTAGSSSLVAVHLACRSLATGETSLALAGGVALDLAPQHAIAQTRRGWLSPDGRSRPFDAGASGWVRAEGVAVVAVKRLAEALRDGDPIHAVILASGVHHDGRGGGIAGPGGDAQIAVIRRVCEDAGLSPGSLQYVEADGASTPTGDAIELAALGAVLADGREPGTRCWIGSVKSNLGHAGAAAGIAGLIKVALCLEHRQIAPHIDLERVAFERIETGGRAPRGIDPARLGLQIPTELTAWPPHVGPACAGVHAIGLGSHAHVVLEEPPVDRRPAGHARPGYNLLPLTARDPSLLPAQAAALARELAGEHGPAPAVSDVGYTLARRRQHLEARLSLVYSSPAELAELLARYLTGETSPRIVAGRRLTARRRLAWVFTGAGAEWWAMGRALLAAEPVYRAVIERCDHEISRFAGWSLIDELSAGEADSNMAEPCLAQLASFALQIGLAALWRSLGVRPDAIVGHGTGELAAFHEAGVYSLEDAIQIAIHRSRLSHARAGAGAMLAAGLSEAAAEARIAPLAGRVAIAAIDGPSSITLSGDRHALDELRAQLAADQIAAHWLPVAIAYHGPAMDRIRDELMVALAELRPRPATLPLYLTAAEGIAGGPELDAAYWWRNVREPVRFRAAIDRMIDAGCGVFLELGPHPVLGGAIADCLAARGAEGRVVPSLRRGEDEPCQIMASLAALHAAGLDIAWDALYPAGRCVPLPAYPWKRDRYWTEPAAIAQVRLGQRDHELLGRRLPIVEPTWEAQLDVEQLPYLADHRIAGRAVVPAAGYLAMAAQAVRVLDPGRCVALGDIELGEPLVLDDRAPATVQLAIGVERATLRIASPGAGDPVVHATATVRVGPARRLGPPLDVAAVQARAEAHRDAEACYAALAELGHPRGPAFRAIEDIWIARGEALARVRAPASLGGAAARYHLHPCLLDACFQTLLCPGLRSGPCPASPRWIAELRICEVGDRLLWVHATITAQSADAITGDIAIYGASGEPLGTVTGLRAAAPAAEAARSTLGRCLYDVAWVEPSAPPEPGEATAGDPWILLADAHGVGAALARQIEAQPDARGGPVWLVRPGPEFALDRAQRAAMIDPGSAADAGALVAAIAPGGQGRRCRVVHLWSLDAPALAETTAAQLRDAAAHATYSLVVMAQALRASDLTGELSIVTRGTQAVSPGAAVEPAGAPAWGVGRALRPGLTGWRTKLIDLELGGDRAVAAAVLARELVTAGEDELALRGGRRFTPRLTPAADLTGSLPVQLRSDGSYLVVGAFGALGRRVCRVLVQRGARRLIAMARSKLPPRISWQALDPAAPATARVRFAQELEALGAEVIVAPVDVTDEPALAGWLAGFRALGYPPIRGVFHAAGEVRGAPVSAIDRAGFDAVHDPKLIGGYLLHKHTAGEPLDHFVVFSSTASLLPSSLPSSLSGAGQVPGAAGSAFLDALAHHRRSAGLPALCVNAGPWEPGAIAALDRPLGRLFDHALGSLLGDDRVQVLVAAVDRPAVLAPGPVAPRRVAGVAGDAPRAPERAAELEVHRDASWFPLTRNQTALWVINQLDPDSCPYHVGRVVAVRARLEPELVFAAVRILIRRHPMLRAHIVLRDGRPVHRIAGEVTADVKLIDVRGWTWVDIHAALVRDYRRPFDLERDPLFRFRLYQRGDRRFLAMQLAHRIVSDPASMTMFLDELLAVYDALRRGVDPVLPPAPAHYLEFVNWHDRLVAGREADRMLRYWTEHLPAELPELSLPTDRPRPDVQTHHGASQWFVLDSDLTARIQSLAHDTGATPFMILLAAYGVLLHRYSGQDDIVVGTPVPGRPGEALARTYGSFANALPLHVSLAGAPSFLALLDRVRATVRGALDHQDYPFAQLVEELGLPHDPSRSAVFQVMFTLHGDRAQAEHHGAVLDRVELPEQDGPLDVTLSVRDDEPEHALRCVLTYNRDLFDAETIRRMASHYTRLLTAALADPRRPVATLRMLGSAERARIVQRWSGADVAVVPDHAVHAMIRRHAALRPDALAVIAPGDGGARIVSYGELDAAAAQLARRLRQAGVVAGDVVAVGLDRSPELVIWLLAILHAGAAYLVVDPEDPDDRIAAMIARARARFVVGAITGRLAELPGCTRLTIEHAPGTNGDPAGPAAAHPAPVPAPSGLDRTACVFCTPGPAGALRAVEITHHGLASAYHAWDVTYRLRSEARVHLQTARAALDRFTGDLVRALCSGGALCLVGEPVARDTARLYEILVHHAVDTAELTPALARDLAAYCLRDGKRLDFLRLAVVGPGAWTVDDDRQLRALLGRRSRVLHVHGVTEAAIDSAYFEGPADGLDPDQLVPIGGPFPGSRLFVLDRHGAPVPAGVAGELWVGGNGVAAGYLGDREASAARFMTVELDDRGAMRLFRTGELVRWDARGTLHAVTVADAGAARPPAKEG